MPATPSDITVLLERSRGGDAAAREQVFAIAYEELRRVASNLMRAERLGHTLSPTAVVNETYLRLVAYDASFTHSRRDFFALCSTVMRHVLADHARQRRRTKRGDGLDRVEFEDLTFEIDPRLTNSHGYEACDLAEAIFDLERKDPRGASILELKVFGGLTTHEVAEHLGVSTSTVARDYKACLSWCYTTLSREGKGPRP